MYITIIFLAEDVEEPNPLQFQKISNGMLIKIGGDDLDQDLYWDVLPLSLIAVLVSLEDVVVLWWDDDDPLVGKRILLLRLFITEHIIYKMIFLSKSSIVKV